MDKEKKECGRLREYISYKNDNVEETLEVESQNLYHILIDGEILNDKTLSTGHTWYLENKDEVEANGLVELIETFSDISYDARYHESQFEFLFEVHEFSSKDVLPTLVFVFKESPESKEVKATKVVNMKIKEEIYIREDLYDPSLPVISVDDNVVDGDEVVYVESNTILEVELGSNSSTGYEWNILNEDEIDRSEAIDIIGKGSKSNCPNDPLVLGCGGADVYLFRIWNVTSDDELSTIRMTYRRSFEKNPNYISEIVIKVKPTSKECTFNGYKCCSNAKKTVYYHDKDGDWSVENGNWCFLQKDKDNEKEEVKTCNYTGDYPICQKTTKVVYIDTEKWGVEKVNSVSCVYKVNTDQNKYKEEKKKV